MLCDEIRDGGDVFEFDEGSNDDGSTNSLMHNECESFDLKKSLNCLTQLKLYAVEQGHSQLYINTRNTISEILHYLCNRKTQSRITDFYNVILWSQINCMFFWLNYWFWVVQNQWSGPLRRVWSKFIWKILRRTPSDPLTRGGPLIEWSANRGSTVDICGYMWIYTNMYEYIWIYMCLW